MVFVLRGGRKIFRIAVGEIAAFLFFIFPRHQYWDLCVRVCASVCECVVVVVMVVPCWSTC